MKLTWAFSHVTWVRVKWHINICKVENQNVIQHSILGLTTKIFSWEGERRDSIIWFISLPPEKSIKIKSRSCEWAYIVSDLEQRYDESRSCCADSHELEMTVWQCMLDWTIFCSPSLVPRPHLCRRESGDIWPIPWRNQPNITRPLLAGGVWGRDYCSPCP